MKKDNISMIDLYQLLFVGLKLSGKIDWSWWWVFAPILSWVALSALLLTAAKVLKPDPKP